MKKIIGAMLFGVMSTVVYGQINLEHTFTSVGGYISPINTNNQTMYYFHDVTAHVLTLYNHDYSLYKTITIAPPSGYQFSPSFSLAGSITTKVFNNDDLVEFGYIFQSTGTPITYKLILYNENQLVVKDFGARNYIYPFQTVNDGLKCSVIGYAQDPNPPYAVTYTNEIYGLPGSLPLNALEELPLIQDQNPFPNPSDSYIILPVSLEEKETCPLNILDMKGRVIDTKVISGKTRQICYDVTSLNPGMYFYQCKGIVEKFIVHGR